MKDFTALKMISQLFKLLGWIVLVGSIAMAIFYPMLMSGKEVVINPILMIGMVLMIGMFISIFLFAASDSIMLFIQIEVNTRQQKININPDREPHVCRNCGHEQLLKFNFCPKCGLDEYGLSEKKSRQKRLTKEVEDEQYKEKIRVIIGERDN